LFLLPALFAISTLAQNDVVRVETNLVTLNVAVTDNSGNYVKGLNKDQFAILDNGKKQDVESFSMISAPVSLGIVYDMHPTTDEGRTASVLQALRQFTQNSIAETSFS
jgi:VWFA-related protein